MGAWAADSRTHVAHMAEGDFYGSERSFTARAPCAVRIEHVAAGGGAVTVLKASTPLQAGEVVDAAFMDVAKLRAFYDAQIADALEKDVLFSLHLKATMMKASGGVHALRVNAVKTMVWLALAGVHSVCSSSSFARYERRINTARRIQGERPAHVRRLRGGLLRARVRQARCHV
jgi:monomeric type NADP-dependent isocitrate dehydrogenase